MAIQYPKVVVGAVVKDDQNRVLLVQSSGKFGPQWIIPGGKIDWGETIEQALRRELKEETNLEVKDIRFVGVNEFIEKERHFVFLEHTCQALNPADVRLNDEAVDFGWYKQADLQKLDIAAPTRRLLTKIGY